MIAVEMIAAADEGGVKLLVGHGHSFDLPYDAGACDDPEAAPMAMFA